MHSVHCALSDELRQPPKRWWKTKERRSETRDCDSEKDARPCFRGLPRPGRAGSADSSKAQTQWAKHQKKNRESISGGQLALHQGH